MLTHSRTFRLAPMAALLLLAACGASGAETSPSTDAPRAEAAAPQPAPNVNAAAAPTANAGGARMVVYKSPTCGCCKEWVKHAEAAGFAVQVIDTANVQPIKTEQGVPGHLNSCHTAVVDGFVVEGHVPPQTVVRLMRERPQGIAGIAVPGMPRGSPGMEVPGGAKDPYDVIAFTREGQVSVYETH